MKRSGFLVATSAMLALAAGAARAEPFTYTGSLQQFNVETTGIYAFVVDGAQGGSGAYSTGGNGTILTGDYLLTAGTVLDIVVGGMGEAQMSSGNSAGGGGGGTFVYEDGSNYLLMVAGGGGGGGFRTSAGGTGTGQAGGGANGGKAGSGGGAGSGGFGVGGGGAGWSGAGGSISDSYSGQGGSTRPSFAGGKGYQGGNGGYGGGGGGGLDGGGGGGGYSGGGGGLGTGISEGPGGGGGSYYDPAFSALTISAGSNTGDGYVSITMTTQASGLNRDDHWAVRHESWRTARHSIGRSRSRCAAAARQWTEGRRQFSDQGFRAESPLSNAGFRESLTAKVLLESNRSLLNCTTIDVQ